MNCYKCSTPLPDHSRFCMACGADVSGEGHQHQTVNIEPDPELLAALQTELGGEFVVERELGRGGMAIVYLGQDTHLGRKVAIKLLPPMLTFGAGPSLIERFKREARTAATLDHPNIIPVYRVSTGGKLFWYVMKYLQGESLDVLLKREGPMDVERAIEILTQAADALDYAHQNNVVHRDIKPANIMLDKRGRVTVTDFGIAKALDTSGLTGSGATIGTPHYMSPEQCNGIGVSGQSDQYSLAVTAYQMFSGHVPFASDSILELMRMHLMDPPPPLGTLRPLPPDIVAAVERGLAKTTAERFPTCSDFARELARAQQDAKAQGFRPTTSARAQLTATTPVAAFPQRAATTVRDAPKPPPKPAPPAGKRVAEPRRSEWSKPLLIGGCVAAAIGAAVLVVVLLKDEKPPVTTIADTAQSVVKTQGQTTAAVERPAVPSDSTKTRAETTAAKAPVVTPPRDVAKSPPKPPATKTTGAKAAGTKTAPPEPAGIAYITVGSRPSSAITINGKPAPRNPIVGYEVTSGRVFIRFQVTDSTGVWTVDTVVTAKPGDRLNLGFVPLKRP